MTTTFRDEYTGEVYYTPRVGVAAWFASLGTSMLQLEKMLAKANIVCNRQKLAGYRDANRIPLHLYETINAILTVDRQSTAEGDKVNAVDILCPRGQLVARIELARGATAKLQRTRGPTSKKEKPNE